MGSKLIQLRVLNDNTLIERVTQLAEKERLVTAEFVLYLAELKRREAYRDLGFGSLWSYLRERLGMSEAGAGRVSLLVCSSWWEEMLRGMGARKGPCDPRSTGRQGNRDEHPLPLSSAR
jgi:hypothetical protein